MAAQLIERGQELQLVMELEVKETRPSLVPLLRNDHDLPDHQFEETQGLQGELQTV